MPYNYNALGAPHICRSFNCEQFSGHDEYTYAVSCGYGNFNSMIGDAVTCPYGANCAPEASYSVSPRKGPSGTTFTFTINDNFVGVNNWPQAMYFTKMGWFCFTQMIVYDVTNSAVMYSKDEGTTGFSGPQTFTYTPPSTALNHQYIHVRFLISYKVIAPKYSQFEIFQKITNDEYCILLENTEGTGLIVDYMSPTTKEINKTIPLTFEGYDFDASITGTLSKSGCTPINLTDISASYNLLSANVTVPNNSDYIGVNTITLDYNGTTASESITLLDAEPEVSSIFPTTWDLVMVKNSLNTTSRTASIQVATFTVTGTHLGTIDGAVLKFINAGHEVTLATNADVSMLTATTCRVTFNPMPVTVNWIYDSTGQSIVTPIIGDGKWYLYLRRGGRYMTSATEYIKVTAMNFNNLPPQITSIQPKLIKPNTYYTLRIYGKYLSTNIKIKVKSPSGVYTYATNYRFNASRVLLCDIMIPE